MMRTTLFLFVVVLTAFTSVSGAKLPQFGKASYYADRFQHRRTANGERYHKDSFTAAHRSLPFGTMVRVTNLLNRKSVVVRINDRGPMTHRRIIDLSKAAAKEIDLIKSGVAKVRIDEWKEPVVLPSGDLFVNKKNSPVETDYSKKPDTKTSSRKPDKADFAVQAGAFHEIRNAKGLIESLEKSGFTDVRIEESVKEGKPLYRVLIGYFGSATEAEDLFDKLKAVNFAGYIVKI